MYLRRKTFPYGVQSLKKKIKSKIFFFFVKLEYTKKIKYIHILYYSFLWVNVNI